MIRGLIIIFLSVVLSAATCIGIMMRYANVSTAQVLHSDKESPPAPHDGSVASVPQSVDATVRQIGLGMGNGETMRSQDLSQAETTSVPGQFDYKKLNTDLQSLSEALLQFNEMISNEINRLKSKSAKSTSSPASPPS